MSSRLIRKVYLVCYDISDDKRRTRVYKALRGAGQHVQFSVFRCVLSDLQLALLEAELDDAIDTRSDQILFVVLGAEDSARAWAARVMGRPLSTPPRTVNIF